MSDNQLTPKKEEEDQEEVIKSPSKQQQQDEEEQEQNEQQQEEVNNDNDNDVNEKEDSDEEEQKQEEEENEEEEKENNETNNEKQQQEEDSNEKEEAEEGKEEKVENNKQEEEKTQQEHKDPNKNVSHPPPSNKIKQQKEKVVKVVEEKVATETTTTKPKAKKPTTSSSSLTLTSNAPSNFGTRFQVTQFLGQGAGGPVSAAVDLLEGSNRDQLVALKRVPRTGAAAEYSMLLQLQHPNIIRVLELTEPCSSKDQKDWLAASVSASSTASTSSSSDLNQSQSNKKLPKNSILLMEYARLGNASKSAVALSKQASIAQREWYAQVVTRDVLRALHHLHRHGIVHRDVKSSNVLLFPQTDNSSSQNSSNKKSSLIKKNKSNENIDENATDENNSSIVSIPSNENNLSASQNSDNTNLKNSSSNNNISDDNLANTQTLQADPVTTLLHSHFVAKLSDFGLATPAEHSASAVASGKAAGDDVAGSVYWMSPEAMQGAIAPCVDIWAAGCLAYELLNAGRPPLSDREWGNAMYVVMTASDEKRPSLVPTLMQLAAKESGNSNILQEVSPPCLDFLTQALTIDPSLRPSATDLLSHDWVRDSSSSSFPKTFISSENQDVTIQQQNTNIAATTSASSATNTNNRSNMLPPTHPSTCLKTFTLERIISACSHGITQANRSWLWLQFPSTTSSTTDNENISSSSAAAAAASSSSSSSAGKAIDDVADLTPHHRVIMTERVKEMIDRLRRTSELVRESMMTATSPFASSVQSSSNKNVNPKNKTSSPSTGLVKFEDWMDVAAPSLDVLAKFAVQQRQFQQNQNSSSSQQQQNSLEWATYTNNNNTNNNNSEEICMQAQVLIARVVWVVGALVDSNLATSGGGSNRNDQNQNRNYNNNPNFNYNINQRNIQHQQQIQQQQRQQIQQKQQQLQQQQQASDTETLFTRRQLLIDLVSGGFWSGRNGLDWSLMYPPVAQLTHSLPNNFAAVEGRSRYTELSRDIAKSLYALFAASCEDPDLRCVKACSRSPHTIRFLFSHDVTRRGTAICLSNAMQRLSYVPPLPVSHHGHHHHHNNHHNQQQQNHPRHASDQLFSPDNIRPSSNHQQQNSGGNDFENTLESSFTGSIPGIDEDNSSVVASSSAENVVAAAAAASSTKRSSSSSKSNKKLLQQQQQTQSSSSTSTGPQQVKLTAQALQEFLPRFLDEAALAVANDPASDAEFRTFDCCVDAFLRVTEFSDELFTITVRSSLFLRKIHVALPPNRVSSFAVGLLNRFAASAFLEPQILIEAGELLDLLPLRTWLTLASNVDVSYAGIAGVMETISKLSMVVPKVAESLVNQSPVISFVLNLPISSAYTTTNNPTKLLNAVTRLCSGDPTTGQAYSSVMSIRDGVVSRLRDALHRKNYEEMLAALQLVGALFTYSLNPDAYSNCDDLIRLVLRIVRSPMNSQSRPTIHFASRLFDTLCAVALF